MRIRILLAWTCLASQTFAAQAPEPSNTLAGARAAFASTDRDGDARLALGELRASLPALTEAEFAEGDADRDGTWSRDEHTVHYRTRLAREGKRPAADLETEVVRILALRRARTVDESRLRGGPAAGRLAKPPDPAHGATPELLDLDARIQRALSDLQDRAAGRGAVAEDFERVRGLWNERVTRVRALEDPSPAGADVAGRFARALDALQAKARAGSVARAEFAELEAAWAARPRRIVTAEKPAEARDTLPVEARFERALAELEARVFARAATRGDWAKVRDLVPERARRLVGGTAVTPPPADDPRVVRAATDLVQSLDRMEQRAVAGSIARSDFQALRAQLAPQARRDPAPSARDARR